MDALRKRVRPRGGYVAHRRSDPRELAPGNYLLTVHEDGTYDAWGVDRGGSTSRGLWLPGLAYLFTLLRQYGPRHPRLGRHMPYRWRRSAARSA